MAVILKRSQATHRNEWLTDNIVDVGAMLHNDENCIEIAVYDRSAPIKRRWVITVINRETQVSCTLMGEFQKQTRDEAFRQIGLVSPYEKKVVAAA